MTDRMASASYLGLTLPDGFQITARMVTTPEEMSRGLLPWSSLKPNEGMLFFFGSFADRTFHTIGMQFSIDMIGVGLGWHVSSMLCRVFPGLQIEIPFCCAVLELPAGTADAHCLDVGDWLGMK